ncbi:putative G-protein coupled receptor 101 [Petromyzon marinus]|uniref:putative G-protein coupled receptor 101 n=1 Tax=Petromyzon marinus TaxID=7757 RepID=UPI003F7051B4
MITALAIAVTDATLSPSTPPSPSTPSTPPPSASPSPSSAAASSAAAFTLLIYSNTTAAAAAAAGDDSGVGGEKGPLVEEPLLLLPTNLPHLHHHHLLLLLGVSLVAAMCTSLFANLLLLGVFYRRPGLLFHIANRFVFNLIVADLLQTTVAMPLCLAPLLSASRPAASYCHVAVALSHLFAFAGVNTIAVVSVDRYLAIIHPLSYPAKMTPRRAANLIACTWAIGALQGGPPLLGWGAAAHDAATGLCAPLWSAHASYAAYVSVATFWLPVCVMLCCYVMVFRAARRQNLLVRPLRRVWSGGVDAAVVSAGGGGGEGEGGGGGGGGGDGGGEGGEGGAGQGQAKERRRYRQHWKAARVVFLILASNVLCTAPYSALGAVAARAPCWVRACAALLFFSQCCVHPYIYGYMHRSIRREIVRALCGLHVPGAGDGGGLAAGGGGAQPRPGGTSADSGQTRSEWRRRRRTMRRMRRTRGRTRRRCGVTQSEPADGSNTDSGAQPLCSSAADSALPSSALPSSALPSSATDGSGARHCGGAAGAVRSALPCCSSSSSSGGGCCCVEESAQQQQQQNFAPADSVHCFSTVDSALPCRPNGSALPCISS